MTQRLRWAWRWFLYVVVRRPVPPQPCVTCTRARSRDLTAAVAGWWLCSVCRQGRPQGQG